MALGKSVIILGRKMRVLVTPVIGLGPVQANVLVVGKWSRQFRHVEGYEQEGVLSNEDCVDPICAYG